MLTYAPPTAVIPEKLLQFIWLHRYYNFQAAYTTEGEKVEILYPGMFNTNQGPDFLNARVVIGNTTWAGHVEIHVNARDWDRHHHSGDSNYDNVILHVVWQQEVPAKTMQTRSVPVLELQSLVSVLMLNEYRRLMEAPVAPACGALLPVLTPPGWTAWKERLAVERLTRKSEEILQVLKQANNHWEDVFWRLLARNFGLKVNASFFEQVAKSLPVNVLAKHKGQINQLEALLLGQANLLEQEMTGTYEKMLQKEFRYLRHKYQLPAVKGTASFLRMRPATFPTVRLAQLAMLIHKSSHLFSWIRDSAELKQVTGFLDITANDYWHYHYRPDQPADYLPKNLGQVMVHNVVINTVVPVLFAYGLHMNDAVVKERAVAWLLQTPGEKNSILQDWQQHTITAANAMDSQALIELKNNYCNARRCLECAVGNALLKTTIQNE